MEELDIEDLKIYFYDMFLTTESILERLTGDAYNEWRAGEIIMSTGIPEGGSSHLHYDNQIFNPTYAEIIFKLRLSSIADMKGFFGFRSNLTEPTIDMVESHAGILMDSGKIYFSSGDGYSQQRVEIVGLDIKKIYEFKIAFDKLYIKPLPQVEQYLGLPTIRRVERVWALVQQNSTYPPDDRYHWITLYMKNKVSAEKLLYLNRIVYKEEYPD